MNIAILNKITTPDSIISITTTQQKFNYNNQENQEKQLKKNLQYNGLSNQAKRTKMHVNEYNKRRDKIKYPASKSNGVPVHLALRATCTFLGLLVCAETSQEDTHNSIITISVNNPDLKWVSIH